MGAAEWLETLRELTLSLGGFALGYVVGRYVRVKYVEAVDHVAEMESEQPDRRSGEDRRQHDRRLQQPDWNDRLNMAFGITLIILAVASVITASVAVTRQTAITECQARYNAAFGAAITERTEAGNQDREAFRGVTDAMERVITTVAQNQQDPPDTPQEQADARAEFIGALDKYLKVTAQYDEHLERSERLREANPLRPAPTEVCG